MQFRYFWKKNRLPFEKRKRLQTGFLQTDLWIKYALKSIEHGDTRVFSFPRNGKSLWQGLGFHLRKSLFYQGGVRNEVNSSRKLKSYQMDITAIWPKYDIFFGHAISKVTYRIVASTNTCYYSENQLFVQRSQYIRAENPLHKQSEKTCMFF